MAARFAGGAHALVAALLLGSAAAATATADQAQPARIVASPYSVDDYPQASLRRGESGYARIAVTVSPEGRPIGCSVIVSTDYPDLDARSCAVMLKRGRFTPAVNEKGQASYAIYRQTVPWFTADTAQEMRATVGQYTVPNDIDIEVMVNKLPAGLVPPVAVIATAIISPEGKLVDCAAANGGAVPAGLAKLACDQTNALVAFKPALDSAGTAVASVQQAKVLFQTQTPAAAK